MSIVPLSKVTLFGLKVEREAILEGLQCLGCMHLIDHQPPAQESGFGFSDCAPRTPQADRYKDAQKALRYIMHVPRRRHQVRDEAEFNLDWVVTAALANKQKQREAEDKKLFLANRLRKLTPWGDFTLPDLNDLGDYRLWFYQVPHTKAKQIQKLELPWQIVGKDHLHVYVVVIAQAEPPADILPVPRTHAGSVSPEELKLQLEQVEIELDEIQAEHQALSRWIILLAKNLARAEDEVSLRQASSKSTEREGIFLVQGWMPKHLLKQLDAFAEQQGLAFLAEPSQPNETPPTLMENPKALRGGQDLVSFYQTPSYDNWDPSLVVFFSFALFFAMILADAGYSLVLAGIVAFYWKQMGQNQGGKTSRRLVAVVLVTSLVYGVLVGSYFGLTPTEGSWLASLQVMRVDNFAIMMPLSIAIGCLHVVLANAVVVYRAVGFAPKAGPLGWIFVVLGGLAVYLGGNTDIIIFGNLGFGLLGGGLLLIFMSGVAGSHQKLPWRLLQGFGALVGITTVFGDILSYLRLFALGLASASLAQTFNQLAIQSGEVLPGPLLPFLILLLGHGINLGLGIISGLVHGLRLNFIEFFRWGLSDEGYPFQAFAKKERDL